MTRLRSPSKGLRATFAVSRKHTEIEKSSFSGLSCEEVVSRCPRKFASRYGIFVFSASSYTRVLDLSSMTVPEHSRHQPPSDIPSLCFFGGGGGGGDDG